MYFDILPIEIIYIILRLFHTKDLFKLREINHQFKLICENIIKFKSIIILDDNSKYYIKSTSTSTSRKANIDEIPFGVIYNIYNLKNPYKEYFDYKYNQNILVKSYIHHYCNENIDRLMNVCHVNICTNDITNIHNSVERLTIGYNANNTNNTNNANNANNMNNANNANNLSINDNISSFKNLTHLTFTYNFNEDITNIDFSKLNNLIYLNFSNYNKIITSIKFPSSLTHLIFEQSFNENDINLDFSTLINLSYLNFGNEFNNYVTNLDLNSCVNLSYLNFGNSFNQNITHVKFNLCDKLTYLEFGDNFNQDIKNVKFPQSIKRLKFQGNYNINYINYIKCKFNCVIDELMIGPKPFTKKIINIYIN